MFKQISDRVRELFRRPLTWALLVVVVLAVGLLAGSYLVASHQTVLECQVNEQSQPITCKFKESRAAALLDLVAHAAISFLAVPIILKLWFWSGIRVELQSALGTHESLCDLGIIERRSQTNTDWSNVIEVTDGGSLTIVAVAGLPLVNESSLADVAKALVARKNTMVRVCVRDPRSFTEDMFANRQSLEGAVLDAEKVMRDLHRSKHATSTVEFGTINYDLKYTLVLGSTTGVYMPHPVNQSDNKSGQMVNIVFHRDGGLFRDFLEHDITYVLAEMNRRIG